MSNRVATDDTLKEVVSAINGIAQAIRGGGTIYGFHINGNESSQDDMVTLLGQDDKVPVPDTYIMSGTGGTTVSIRKFPRG